MNVKIDWDLEIKKFLSENFEPVTSIIESDRTEKMTLSEVHAMVKKIFPRQWIYEEDVYNALEDLGFKNLKHIVPEEVDEDGETITDEHIAFAYFLKHKTMKI